MKNITIKFLKEMIDFRDTRDRFIKIMASDYNLPFNLDYEIRKTEEILIANNKEQGKCIILIY